MKVGSDSILPETLDWSDLFPKGIHEFYFVLNDRYTGAVSPRLHRALEEIRREYGLERCEAFLSQRLENELFSLGEDKIASIVGFVADPFATPTPTSEPSIEVDELLDDLARAVASHARLTRLPALFETTETLPVATAYVDLTLAARQQRPAAPHLLEHHKSPAERIMRREEERYQVRRTPRQLLDRRDVGCVLILGGPGAGKSSLLRRIALDIAAGQWFHKQAVVFAEARRFWSRRKSDEPISLLRFAIEDTMDPLRRQPSRVLAAESLLLSRRTSDVLLLVDGLDEIAADAAAVDCIYGELEALSLCLDWITTCRPAGLVRSCGEQQRSDMAALDEEAVELLIENWSSASGYGRDLADRLKSEISNVPALRQMATNPFLLASLCFLKSAALDERLPVSRVAVFEELIKHIGLQAQRRFADATILDAEALRALSGFCYWLYDRPTGPVQVFSLNDWRSYGDASGPTCDLGSRILPTRLIAAWSEDDPQYHFVHLSLQEHLLGHAMLGRDQQDFMSRRFAPAWRLAFRAYAALLYYRGEKEAFRELVWQLHQEKDLSGFALSALAEIFADAGIRDTTSWLGADLRVDLLEAKENLIDQGSVIVTDALAMLDPEYFEAYAHESIDDLDDQLEALESEYPEDFLDKPYPGEPYVAFGREEDDFYRLLVKAGTPSAYATVREAFFGTDQRRALVAAIAFVDVARPRDRKTMAGLASKSKILDDFATRVWVFVSASRRPELMDFVLRVAGWSMGRRNELFEDAISILMDMETDTAYVEFEKLLDKQMQLDARAGERSAPLAILLRHVGQLPTERARELFARASRHRRSSLWEDLVTENRMSAGLLGDAEMLERLGHPATRMQALGAIGAAVSRYARMPSPAVVARAYKVVDKRDTQCFAELARLEAARIRAGSASRLLPLFFDEARSAFDSLGSDPSRDKLFDMQERLDAMLQPLCAARHRPTLTLLHEILSADALLSAEGDRGELAEAILEDAIRAASDIIAGNCLPEHAARDDRIVADLTALLFQPVLDCAHAAAYALGRIDFGLILDLRGAPIVQVVMEQLSAEYSLMIFPDFWTDVLGRIHHHLRPQINIGQVYLDADDEELGARMAHQLARYGVVAVDAQERNRPVRFQALIVYGSAIGEENADSEWRKELCRQLPEFPMDVSAGPPTFKVFEELSQTEIVERARVIAEAAKEALAVSEAQQH